MKPDSLLPFAIAAILGFLVLGLRGGEGQGNVSKGEAAPESMDELRANDRGEIDRLPVERFQIVKHFSAGSGQWRELESFREYKIQMMDANPDFRIEPANNFSDSASQ
ncbi:MAG TPA: hypothetical protein VIS99_00175 [Terrimicrobiaceae bacterium]